jgi:hypothetical protein
MQPLDAVLPFAALALVGLAVLVSHRRAARGTGPALTRAPLRPLSTPRGANVGGDPAQGAGPLATPRRARSGPLAAFYAAHLA